MRERPPGDDGSPWDEVLAELADALDDSGVLDPENRDLVLEALNEAVLLLGEEVGGAARPEGGDAERDRPPVTVVDGGRRRDQPRSRKPRPELRVAGGGADPDDDAAGDGSAGEGAEEGPGPRPRLVAEIRLSPRHTLVARTPGRDEPAASLVLGGRVDLQPEETQQVYAGPLPRSYRILCQEGRFTVVADGLPDTGLRAGQSVDVEARWVKVVATDGAASGGYLRLPDDAPPS